MFIPSRAFASALTIAALLVGSSIASQRIISTSSSLCLHVNDDAANNVEVDLSDCESGNVFWDVPDDEQGSIKTDDFCLDVTGSNFADGTQLQLYQCLGNAAQRFDYDAQSNL